MRDTGGAAPATWREWLVLVAAVEALAVTLWLLRASVHIVSWPAAGPVRLALLSPAWMLAAWLAAGLGVAVALALSQGRSRAASVLAPFVLLWVLGLPYLPWLPDRLPLLLVLAGPIRWVLIAVALVRAVMVAWGGAQAAVERVLGIGRITVFVVSLALYAGFGVWSVTTNGLGGDEPHYLIITESLLRDRDLQIENNHQRGDYRSFFRGDLRPDYMQRGQHGEVYSIHAPGLPALVLPVYAVAGYLGVIVFIAFLAALTALAVFDLASLVSGPRVAVLTWLGVCLTVPFVPHSWAIFPEMPGALLVAWAALWLVQPADRPSVARWACRGIALAALPWLHTKFIVLLAIFSAGLGVRLLKRIGRLVALAVPIAASCALWLYSFYAMYGKFDPEAPYGAYSKIFVLTSNIPHGLLGLFFDQKFGLLVYSPLYLVAIAGAWFGLRDSRLRFASVILLATIAAFVISTARLYMFWGGSSAPARFFVPVLPCLAPFVALGLMHARTAASKAVVGLWLGIGLGFAAIGVVSPARLMLFSDPHGRARLLDLFQGGSPLALVVPTFTDPDWTTQIGPLAVWMIAAVIAAALVGVAARTRWNRPWALAGVAAFSLLVAGAVLTAHPSASVREATANRGDLDVLWRYDGAVFRTLDYQRLSRTTPDRFRDLTTLHLHPSVAADAKPPFEAGPLMLPPGKFDASVWFTGARPRDGEIAVASPRAVFGSTSGSLANPATFEVVLPVAAARVVVRIPDLQVARSVSEVQLAPRDVVPPRSRDPRPARTVEGVPGHPRAYLVYTDGDAYPEMGTFWSRGTAATTVLLAPGGASRLTLALSTGPMSGLVKVTIDGHAEQVSMVANEEHTMQIDLPAGERLVPITVQSSVMFRPGEVSTGTNDMRGLGCQVRFSLE